MATASRGLQPEDHIKCDVCGEVHVARLQAGGDRSTASQPMLFVFCAKPRPGQYYVGTVGGRSNRGPAVQRKKKGGE